MENTFLPSDFKVYINPITREVINYSEFGFEEKILPTFDDYSEQDGGYVAVYTREKESGIYSVGGEIYIAGQVRIKGNYLGHIFYPQGYNLGDDISQDKEILEICKKYFPELKGKMWIGGDTGQWH